MSWRGWAVGMLGAASLLATGPFAKGAEGWPCTDAVNQYCRHVTPGSGRILACLRSQESNLTPECKAACEKAEAHRQALEASCGSDINTFCKDTDDGRGGLWNCLKAQESNLSASCKEFTSGAEEREAQESGPAPY